jgi:hypothetical protein
LKDRDLGKPVAVFIPVREIPSPDVDEGLQFNSEAIL